MADANPRPQPTKVTTRSTRRKLAFALYLGITAVCVAVTVYSLWYTFLRETPYEPPPYDINAVKGNPEPPINIRYGLLDTDTFTAGIAGVMQKDHDNALILYFANPEESEVNLMCEVFVFYPENNQTGQLLYRSGLLKPGEYVSRLPLLAEDYQALVYAGEIAVKINVYAFEQETYHSVGTAVLESRIDFSE
jgi:hypothetical protein